MEIINSYQSIPDKNGIYEKTTIYKNTENLETIKEVKRIQKSTIVQKIHKDVLKRQKEWKPFGKALQENNNSCTFRGGEVFIEYKDNNCNSNSTITKNKSTLEIFDEFYDKLYISRNNLKDKDKNKNKLFKPTKTKYKYKPPSFSSNKKDTKDTTDKTTETPKTKKYVFKPKEKDPNDNSYKTKLFIENIPPDFLEDDIAEYIESYGDIKDILILRDKYTGRSKCVGIISLYKNSVAQSIIDNCHKKPMGSMIVTIKYAKDRDETRKNKKYKKYK